MPQATVPATVLMVEHEFLISRLVAGWLCAHGFAVYGVADAEGGCAPSAGAVERGG